ncbi:hypothetical protein DRJ19_04105 [Candidatus Woesearchaeota archaeon]|nr:MAG: hypothetical protein DRJ19_04105 [Candidatus Woesearchaeota archaeon]
MVVLERRQIGTVEIGGKGGAGVARMSIDEFIEEHRKIKEEIGSCAHISDVKEALNIPDDRWSLHEQMFLAAKACAKATEDTICTTEGIKMLFDLLKKMREKTTY